MPSLTIGLVPGKVAFYCEKTRTNLTLVKPYATVVYNTADEIARIVNALLSPTPSLVFYSGEILEEAIAAWETKQALNAKKGRDFIVMDHKTNTSRVAPNRNAAVRAQELREIAVPAGVPTNVKAAAYSVPEPDEAPKQEVKQEQKAATRKTTASAKKQEADKEAADTAKEE